MKIKVAELEGAELDYWVAKALGWKQAAYGDRVAWVQADGEGRFRCNFNEWNPSLDWSQGGPIIERKRITTECANIKNHLAVNAPYPVVDDGTNHDVWRASILDEVYAFGTLPLEVAMRCFVASKFGEEVEE